MSIIPVGKPNSKTIKKDPEDEKRKKAEEERLKKIEEEKIKTEEENKIKPEYKEFNQDETKEKIDSSLISERRGNGGSDVQYIEGHVCINLLNDVFGTKGWSSEVRSKQYDVIDNKVCAEVTMRITLLDGSFREDVGHGDDSAMKDKIKGREKAMKEAVTDGIKRVARQFGNKLGNCLYDKVYLEQVKKERKMKKNLIKK